MYNLVLRWQDKKGKKYRKVYHNRREAEKARLWLINSGGRAVDIAIELTTEQNRNDPDLIKVIKLKG